MDEPSAEDDDDVTDDGECHCFAFSEGECACGNYGRRVIPPRNAPLIQT